MISYDTKISSLNGLSSSLHALFSDLAPPTRITSFHVRSKCLQSLEHTDSGDTGALKKAPKETHINGIPLEDAELQEELQFDLPLLEEFLHLGLGLVQLLQDALNVVDGAVVGRLVAGDGRVPGRETHN